jgi:hypothetical protein
MGFSLGFAPPITDFFLKTPELCILGVPYIRMKILIIEMLTAKGILDSAVIRS